MDDFLVIGANYGECQAAQQRLIHILTLLGFTLNWEKVVGPTQRVKFLGLIVDSVQQHVELPQDKLTQLLLLCSSTATKQKVSKRDLQVLVGHMTFAARAIFAARAFSRVLIDALNSV